VAGLILIGLAVLHLPSVRGRVLDRTRAYVQREFGVTLNASSLSYNVFRRSVELRDLSLASAEPPFLEADRARVVLGPGIFLGRTTVTSVSLSRPRLTLVRYADGSLNLPRSQPSTQEPSPLRLGIVSVTALSARLEDRVAQRSFTVGPFDLAVDTAATSTRPGAFGPGAFTARAAEIEMSGTIGGRLAFDGTRVRIDELTAQTREGRVALTGWVDVIGARPAISARVSTTIDLPQALRLARVDARGLAGHLESTIDVSGTVAAPAVALAVTTRGASYAPIGPVRVTGRSSFSGSRALIDNLDVDSPAGALNLRGAIDLSDTTATAAAASRIALRWSNLHVDSLVQAFGRSLPIRSGSLASGSATVDFDVRDLEARAWSRLRAAATSTLLPATGAPSPESLGLSGRADLQIDRGRWSVRHSIQAPRAQADLAGDATGRLLEGANGLRSTLGGATRLRVADISTLPPLLRAARVSVPPEAVDGLAGSIAAAIDLDGTLENPQARIALDVRGLRAQVLPHAVDLNARLHVDANGVRAQHVQAAAGTTSLQAQGEYLWRGRFNARVEMTQGDLSEIASRFALPIPVAGSARLEGTISGVSQNAQAVYALSARDLALDQISVGPLEASGKLALSDGGLMTVDLAAPAIGAHGQFEIVNRAGYPVSGEVTLDHDRIGELIPPRYRVQIGDVSGRLSATARGSGTLSDPAGIRGRVDLRALDMTVRGTRLALMGPASVTLIQDRIAVGAVDIRVGDRTRATLVGELGVNVVLNPFRLHLDGPLSELIAIGARTTSTSPVAVRGDGTATLDMTVAGTLDHPLPDGTLVVRSPSLEYGTFAPVTGLSIDATIDPTLITLRTFVAQWQGASLAAEGMVPWRVVLESAPARSAPGSTSPSRLAAWLNAVPAEPARARVTARIDNVTQSALKDLVAPEHLKDIQATAAATVSAEADRLSLDRVQATAVLDRVSLTLAGVPFTQTVPTRLRLENGRARIEAFQWNTEGNSIVASGEASLTSPRPSLDLRLSGVLDLRVLGAFVSGIAARGTADANLSVTGPFDTPDVTGRITLADGELQVESPRLGASDVAGTIRIAAGRKATVSLLGVINTGNASVEGTLDLADLAAPLGKLHLTARGIALEYPSGLQTESNADIELALGTTPWTLSGRVDVLGGTYREPLVLSNQLLSLSSASGIARAAPTDDWLSRLRLNLTVATTTDVRIDNNYGRLDVGASFRVVGTAASPGVLGRLQAADDGEIYLGGNAYRIERLTIDLTNPRAITPEVNFSAQTRIGDLPIGVELRCPASAPCERKVTSLATGVDDKVAEARLFGTSGGAVSAGEGLARLLSGELLGVVGRTVGLDAIRLEQGAEHRDIFDDPTLIAGDVDPAARLTLAKRLGSNVELVFSQNLADDGFTWITSYLGPYGLSARVLVFDDQSRSYEFRHEPPIGAGRSRRPSRPPGPRIAGVRIVGSPGVPEDEIRRQLRLGEGDRFTFAAWQRDRDRLERFYRDQNFFEARIRARQLPTDAGESPAPGGPARSADGKVVLEYAINRGPATKMVIRGATIPDDVRDRIVERWTSALFDGFLERDARAIVREHFSRLGHLQAAVTAAVTLDASRSDKTLAIDVLPGAVLPRRVEMTGNSALSTPDLLALVEKADALSPWLDPRAVERVLENYYRSEGFLAVDVLAGAPEIRDGTSVVAIAVAEGTPYTIGKVEVSGFPPALEQELRGALAFSTGTRYRPAGLSAGVDRLEASLRRAAYREASTEVNTGVDEQSARVDITVRVTPGGRSILREVEVQGADANKPIVARSIALEANAPLDPAAIRETRRRLYDLDVFRSVDITVQPLAAASPQPSAATALEQPVVARIALQERARYRLRYGLAVSDEELRPDERDRRLGFAADLENRNIFGLGATAGASLRLRQDQQVGRVTLGARRLFALPIRSTLFVEREREQLDPENALPITSDVSSFTAEQAYRIRPSIEWRYGYGFDKNHTFIRSEDPDAFDITVNIARFTTSGLVERRDDAFNPARGWFAASTFELSRPGLGSDLSFVKDFAQYSHFVPFGRGLVLASAVRVGLARTFDDEVLIPSERFFAGGANSVRGYREDDLGARSVVEGADGGSALLVLNGELRFPVYRWLKGVGFVDLGNVYPKVSDISFSDLQIGVGAGARFDTPFGLIRFDLGIPANRRSFDPRWRVHVGLGHAF
jgi:outer membrane protein assembly complex protein YaeT